MENQETGETGGRKKGNDNKDKKKDKKKMTNHAQKVHAICWAITLIRAIEALLNIGLQIENQRTLSIQHLVNNVTYKDNGLLDLTIADRYIEEDGVLNEAECSYTRSLSICEHEENVERVRIDNIVDLSQVDDVDLLELVRRQPIIGHLQLCFPLLEHRHGIYKGFKHALDLATSTHAVLIIGYDIDDQGNAYWIIQNSWGVNGFGYVQRQTKRGKVSKFVKIKYPVKEGYPKQNKKKK